jgi:hypothetical protein
MVFRAAVDGATTSGSKYARSELLNRNMAQKHVWRAAIVLLSADDIGTTEIMGQNGTAEGLHSDAFRSVTHSRTRMSLTCR